MSESKTETETEIRTETEVEVVEVDGLTYRLYRSGQVLVHPEGAADRVQVGRAGTGEERSEFVKRIAEAYETTPDAASGHLALLLDRHERRRARAGEDVVSSAGMPPDREAKARALLQQPDLLDRAAGALGELGYVGERENRRLAYLVATSRLLDEPLSCLIRSASASGKSTLLRLVCKLLPAEAYWEWSRVSTRALYYLEHDALVHRVVLIDEHQGGAEAEHSIRVLQTRGELQHVVTQGGGAEQRVVRGPIALMSSTTSGEINAENLSRCLELTLDESPEQTRRIQEAQRRRWTCAGGEANVEVWQDAQSLLEPHRVLIPFAERLTFPARTPSDRRGNEKLLRLVAAHALLHQFQRKLERGSVVATPADYEAVYALIQPLLERDLGGLSGTQASVYRMLRESTGSLTAREVEARLGCSFSTANNTVRALVKRGLVEQIGSRARNRQFVVAADSPLGPLAKLLPPAALR